MPVDPVDNQKIVCVPSFDIFPLSGKLITTFLKYSMTYIAF